MNISVIVPVYNVEEYLHYAVESLAKQTYKDFEVILVNGEHSLNGACPVCGEQQVCEVDYSGGGKFIRSALTWNIHRATCRVCGEKWTGQENMRILAVSLLQQS